MKYKKEIGILNWALFKGVELGKIAKVINPVANKAVIKIVAGDPGMEGLELERVGRLVSDYDVYTRDENSTRSTLGKKTAQRYRNAIATYEYFDLLDRSDLSKLPEIREKMIEILGETGTRTALESFRKKSRINKALAYKYKQILNLL